MMPRLSVILPVYNGDRFLNQALQSLVIQGSQATYEIVAADDGSTDRSLEILAKYETRLPLRIVRGPRVGNWTANSNRALAESRGDYVCFLHQDDVWLPGRLDWILSTVSAHPEVMVMCSAARYIGADGSSLGMLHTPFQHAAEGYLSGPEWFCPLVVQNYLAMPAPVFRRDALPMPSALDESLRFTADWKLWLTLAARYPVWHCPMPTVGYRLHAGAQTCALTTQREEYRRQLVSVYDQFQGDLPAAPSSEVWRHAARISIGVNLALAAGFHGQWPRSLFRRRTLPPVAAWPAYWRSSRIAERVSARVRALVLNRRTEIDERRPEGNKPRES